MEPTTQLPQNEYNPGSQPQGNLPTNEIAVKKSASNNKICALPLMRTKKNPNTLATQPPREKHDLFLETQPRNPLQLGPPRFTQTHSLCCLSIVVLGGGVELHCYKVGGD